LQVNDDIEIIVKEGSPAAEIINIARQKNVDLIIMGRKNDEEASINILKKVTRLAHCSVIMVPEPLPEKRGPLVVPIDFSDASKMAVEQAFTISSKNRKDNQVCLVNFYSVPSGYHKTGKTFEEFAEIMKLNAQKEWEIFSKNLLPPDANYSIDFQPSKHSVAADLNDFVEANNAGLIVIGSKGRTYISSLIIGSTAEKFIELQDKRPFLVVKNKKENMGFHEAMMNV